MLGFFNYIFITKVELSKLLPEEYFIMLVILLLEYIQNIPSGSMVIAFLVAQLSFSDDDNSVCDELFRPNEMFIVVLFAAFLSGKILNYIKKKVLIMQQDISPNGFEFSGTADAYSSQDKNHIEVSNQHKIQKVQMYADEGLQLGCDSKVIQEKDFLISTREVDGEGGYYVKRFLTYCKSVSLFKNCLPNDNTTSVNNMLAKAVREYTAIIQLQKEEVEEIQHLLVMAGNEIHRSKVEIVELKEKIKSIVHKIGLEKKIILETKQASRNRLGHSDKELAANINELLRGYPSLSLEGKLNVANVQNATKDCLAHHELVKELVATYLNNKYAFLKELRHDVEQIGESIQKLNI